MLQTAASAATLRIPLPLTHEACLHSYCTFASHEGLEHPSHDGPPAAYLSKEEVLEIAREGERNGCTEALFTLGDRPEARWPDARTQLNALGHTSTIEYLAECCELVLQVILCLRNPEMRHTL